MAAGSISARGAAGARIAAVERRPRVPALHAADAPASTATSTSSGRGGRGGLSVGINLDPQKTCNFDCVYCEVIDRREMAKSDRAAADRRGRGRGGAGAPSCDFSGTGPARSRSRSATSPSPATASPPRFRGFLPLARRLFDVRDAAALPSGAVRPDHERERPRPGRRCGRRTTSSPRAAGAFWMKLDAGTRGVLPGGLPDVGPVRPRSSRT